MRLYRTTCALAVVASMTTACARGTESATTATAGSGAQRFGGFDPGMNLKYAAGTYPSVPSTFSEFCERPDGSQFSCKGSIPEGKGFYTLAYGEGVATQTCALNSGQTYTPLDKTQAAPCPYYFKWATDAGRPVAEVKTDSRGFPVMGGYPNLSNAIMQNIPAGIYAGLDHNDINATPFMRDVESVTFQMRARVCRKAFDADDVSIVRAYTYVSWGVRGSAANQQIAVNLASLIRAPAGAQSNIPIPPPNDPVKGEEELGGPPGTGVTIHMNGPAVGVSPAGFRFAEDNTSDCSGSWDGVPFYPITLDMAAVLKAMGGRLEPETLQNGRVYSLMMGGIEVWGRMQAVLQIKGYTLKLKSTAPPSNMAGNSNNSSSQPSGQAPAASNAPSSSTGQQSQNSAVDSKLAQLRVNAKCDFDGAHYLRANPDVANSSFNSAQGALDHYKRYGIKEGRSGGCPPTRDEVARILGGQSVAAVQPPIVAAVQPPVVAAVQPPVQNNAPGQPQAQNNAPSRPAIPSGLFRTRSNLGQIWYGNNGQMCLYKNKRHAGVARVEDVTTIVDVPVDPNSFLKCPGYDSI